MSEDKGTKLDLDIVECNLHNGNYLPEQLPPAMLAFIARIRELEAGLTELLDECAQSSEDPDAELGDLRALVAKGTVLP